MSFETTNTGSMISSCPTRRGRIRAKRAMLAATLSLSFCCAMSGCSSTNGTFASLNPFSRTASPASGLNSPTSTQSFASNSNGTEGRLASFGKSAKSAWGKTTNAVTGVFRRENGDPMVENDPLSLSNKPKTVDPKVFVATGQLWESTGEEAKAAENYQRALKIDPEHAGALASYARLNYRQGNLPAAAELLQKALKTSPNDPQLYNELGFVLHKLGRSDMAITLMKRALEISPNTNRFANELASVMFESGNTDGAYEILVKNNKPAVAHFNMAFLQSKAGSVASARYHLGEALKFESAAESNPTVKRAVSRSKDLLAQLDALSKPATMPAMPVGPSGKPGTAVEMQIASQPTAAPKSSDLAKPAAATPSSQTPPAASGPIARVASSDPNATFSADAIQKPGAPSTPPQSKSVPFGYGWPGVPTKTVSDTTKRVPTRPAVATSSETKVPSWLQGDSASFKLPSKTEDQTSAAEKSAPKADSSSDEKPTPNYTLP